MKYFTLTILFICGIGIFKTYAGNEVRLYRSDEKVEYDSIPYMVNDPYFNTAYSELIEMFDGKIEYSLKRAEYLVEWAYDSGNLDYIEFCHDIDSIAKVLKDFILLNNLQQYRTAPNFAIFTYFKTSSVMNGYKPFSYDFDDFTGRKDFSKLFVSKLIRTHKGQCTSMPLLYKILCDELGGQSALALAPRHMYIKHIGEDGKWVNVELTHVGFVRDIWMIETMDISTEAIRSGTFLTALSDKENIAFMVMLLSKAYQQKYGSWDFYIQRSVEKVLQELPYFSDALVMKLNVFQNLGLAHINRYGDLPTPYLDYIYGEYKSTVDILDRLGYSQQTDEEYDARVNKAKESSK